MSYNKFNKDDILILKKEYLNAPYERCKIQGVILNTPYNDKGRVMYSLDNDYYSIEEYPKIQHAQPVQWIDMSSAHVIYELDIREHRKLKLEQLNERH